ncbi:hypothetical protein V6N12_069861 [Hibiscus sabdariffa]|uniref:Uncharacterized protein n=1 Tax=Hibiscus sabdariffa TaxID=183260 RepID=A0ABR2FF25_9ROSI
MPSAENSSPESVVAGRSGGHEDSVSHTVAGKGQSSQISDIPVVPGVEQLWKAGCSGHSLEASGDRLGTASGASFEEVQVVMETVNDGIVLEEDPLLVESADNEARPEEGSLNVEPDGEEGMLLVQPTNDGVVLEEGSLGVAHDGDGVLFDAGSLSTTEKSSCIGLPSMHVNASTEFQDISEGVRSSMELPENLVPCDDFDGNSISEGHVAHDEVVVADSLVNCHTMIT